MLQFLRFDKERVERSEFRILADADIIKFFAGRFLYLILLIYATLFLAAIITGAPTNWVFSLKGIIVGIFERGGAYFFGGMIITIYMMRLINHIIKYRIYTYGKIIVSKDSIEVTNKTSTFKIPAENITFLEVNVFGNIIIREKYNSTSFPLALLNNDDKNAFVSLFQDMAPNRTRTYKKIWEFVDAIFVAFILAMHIRQFIVQAYYIPTGSMENTLQVGDHLLVEKLTYGPMFPKIIGMSKEARLFGLRNVKKGDIIIFSNSFFKSKEEEERDFIKRCIATEGDFFHVNEEDGFVYINGNKVDEPYIKEYSKMKAIGYTDYRGFGSKKIIEGQVPPGMVIAMGDNRTNSQDSRYFGYVPVAKIKGRAFILYWNTDQIFNWRNEGDKDVFFQRFGLIR
jgi:signal peptidase I